MTGQIVYVNYGRVEDLDKLVALGVDLTDKIAICRYGKIFRGSKVSTLNLSQIHDTKIMLVVNNCTAAIELL